MLIFLPSLLPLNEPYITQVNKANKGYFLHEGHRNELVQFNGKIMPVSENIPIILSNTYSC